MSGWTTAALHGVRGKDPHGTLRPPVYDSAAFEFENSESMRLAFAGRSRAHSYSRVSNPTVADFEDRIRVLSGGLGAVAFSSGMAAISAMVLALAESGGHIVAARFLFGNTLSLFEHTLKPWGLRVDYVDAGNPDAVERAILPDTRAVFVEVISNPQLQVPDIGELALRAHARGVPLVVDGTTTAFSLFSSRSFGADIEVVSSTKAISGGATSVGGVMVDNGVFDWFRSPKIRPWAEKAGPGALLLYLRREVARNLGACLSPHNACYQTLGLETLELRLARSSANAMALAAELRSHPKVRAVHYPGLPDSPHHDTARRQFRHGYGSLFCLELAGPGECFRFQDRLRMVRRATNIGDNKTLTIHPASTIFAEYSPAERAAMSVPDAMVRISAGIEDVDDLREDIFQALEGV